MDDEKYDVVIATLKEKYDKLWQITQGNIRSGGFNVMDQIRLEQMDHLGCAIDCWKKYKREWVDDDEDEE